MITRLSKLPWLRQLSGGMVVMLLTAWVYLVLPQSYFSLDNRLRDFLFLLRGEQPHTGAVVIVDIDEKSLREYGQWPWSRNQMAALVAKLADADAGAGIVGLDMVFAEPDRTSPARILKSLGISGRGGDDYDAAFAETLQNAPVVGGYFFLFEPTPETRLPMVPAVFVERGGRNDFIPEAKGLVLNTPPIQNALYTSGFFNSLPDEGGVIRHVPLLMRYEGMLYPSLALEMYRIYAGASRVELTRSPGGVASITVGDTRVPTDRFGRLGVNFRGPGHHFPYVSAADVLSGRFDPERFAGRFVLVGVSALGLFDQRSTPFDDAVPGVEVHASVIDNLIGGDFIARPEAGELIDLSVIAVTILLVFLIVPRVRVWMILPLFLGGIALQYLFFSTMLFDQGVILNIIFPLQALTASVIVAMLGEYMVTHRQKQLIMNAFAKKVSPGVMGELIRQADADVLAPVEREVTVFFSDIRSFTTLSETIGSPSRLIALLNRYMTPMVELIVRQRGTVDKFIGDAIMAYWNAPNRVEAHADRAVRAALEQMTRLQTLNDAIREEYGNALSIGIGINTGVVTVGEMGSKGRSDYTIIGDHVNLASRLEGLNKRYGSAIIISEHTRRALNEPFPMRPLDIVRVKGKHEAVEIYEVIPEYEGGKLESLPRYTEALERFRTGDVSSALALFETLERDFGDTLFTLYVQRCRYWIEHPRTPFDVVVTSESK